MDIVVSRLEALNRSFMYDFTVTANETDRTGLHTETRVGQKVK